MVDSKATGRQLPVCISFILLLMVEKLAAQTTCRPYGMCDLTALSTDQTITSDKYPELAFKVSSVEWRITTNSHHLVNLTFTDVITEGPRSCRNTFLQVLDETDDIQFDLAKICHAESSVTYISSYSTIFIKYVGPPNVLLRFKFHYQIAPNPMGDACIGLPLLLRASNDVKSITSPNYPSQYPHNSKCRWRIVSQDKEKLVQVHVDGGRLTECSSYTHDYIQIFDGTTEYDDLVTTLCGRFVEHERVSSTQAMYMEFHSGSHMDPGVGFHISYQAIDNERMFEKHLTAGTEEIEVKYPSYPSLYPNHAGVSWKIQSVEDRPISLSILYHRIEISSNCQHDALKIYDGASEIGSRRLKRLCGTNESSITVVSSGPVIFVAFLSDASVVNSGFKFKFSIIPGCPLSQVSVEANETGKTITSPGFPNHYAEDILCRWQISNNRGLVKVKIKILDLKNESSCENDYLRIYDGYSSGQELLKSFCGNSPQLVVAPFMSTSRVVYMEFRSGEKKSSNLGFKLVVQGINLNLSSSLNDFHSPQDDSSDSSDSKKTVFIAVGIVVGVLLLATVAIVLLVYHRQRIQKRRAQRATDTNDSVTTSGNVTGTNRQQAGLYSPDSSGLSQFKGSTAADGDTPRTPSYTDFGSDSQHLIMPPAYKASRPPDYSFEDRIAFDGEGRADDSHVPPTNYTIV